MRIAAPHRAEKRRLAAHLLGVSFELFTKSLPKSCPPVCEALNSSKAQSWRQGLNGGRIQPGPLRRIKGHGMRSVGDDLVESLHW